MKVKLNLDFENQLFENYREQLDKSRLKEKQCLYCRPNKGENQKEWRRKSWKIYRKTQYKILSGKPG